MLGLGWIRRRGFSALLLTFMLLAAHAQAPGAWKPISAKELALKDNSWMPGDSAILLDRDSYVDDVKSFLTEYYRIKIFKDEGRRFADIEIPYVPNSEEVVEIRARIVGPDGTPAEFQGEIFDRPIVRSRHFKYQAKTFTLPDVQAGSIIEYSYRLLWRQHAPDVLKHPGEYAINDAFSIPTAHWKIQHELFTRHARFSVRPLPKGNLQWALVRGPSGATVQWQPDGTALLEVRNIPPLEKEEFTPPEDLINSRVHFFYGLGLNSDLPGNASWFWSSVGRREADAIEKFIGHCKRIDQLTRQLIAPTDSDETKLRKIYEHVQQIRYLSYEPAKSEKGARQENLKPNKDAEDVLNHGYAYANEINYLFAAMVRAAGLPAFAVKLADRSRHVFDPAVLDASQLNAVVIDVPQGKDDSFFDPATRFCPFELVPWGESGVKGLRISARGGDFVSIPGYHSETAVIRRTATAKLDPDGTLEGRLHVAFAGQDALTRRLELYAEDEAGRYKALEEEIRKWLPNNAKIEIISTSGWDISKGDLQVDGQFSVPQFATSAGRRRLVSLSIFCSTLANPFKPDKRTYPVYFPYSYRTEDYVSLEFPDGFRLEALPAPHSETFNASRFHTTVKQKPDGVEFQRFLDMDGFIFPREMYANLKRFFDHVSAADAEQAVLQQAK